MELKRRGFLAALAGAVAGSTMGTAPPSAALPPPPSAHGMIDVKRLLALALKEKKSRLDKAACEASLVEFIKQSWHVIEPGAEYVHNWHVNAMADHLASITRDTYVEGELFNRLLINVPPGLMKSLLVSVFWPAWEWGPCNKPYIRILSTSHDVKLAIRDAIKMRRLVTSEWYVEKWGDRFKITTDQNEKTKFENDAGGFRQASSAKSITGNRADRIIIDDPLSVADAASDIERANVREWFLESVPTRLVNPRKSAIVVIMQRLHEADISGIILDGDLGYQHVCLPMVFEEGRRCRTPILWKAPWMREPEPFCDPRDQDGDLLFPARFPQAVVDRDAKAMGEYATAGQMQQRPEPRGGGIIKREYWRIWDAEAQREHDIKVGMFPNFEYIVASFDGAFGQKKENDYSALTVWGVWVATNIEQRLLGSPGTPRLMLMHAWRKKLTLHGKTMNLIEPAWGETQQQFQSRKESHWGIVEHIAATCTKFKVDLLLIEAKQSGLSVEQEMRRLFSNEKWSVRMVDPGGLDKEARVWTSQPVFADGGIWRPDTDWGDMVENEFASFPKAAHDDLVDTSVQAINFLRKLNFIPRADEAAREYEEDRYYRRPAAGRVFYEA